VKTYVGPSGIDAAVDREGLVLWKRCAGEQQQFAISGFEELVEFHPS